MYGKVADKYIYYITIKDKIEPETNLTHNKITKLCLFINLQQGNLSAITFISVEVYGC